MQASKRKAGCQISPDRVETFNVASHTGLPGCVNEMWGRFANAGFPDESLPDERGWMPTRVFSGHVVGRIAIRDELADQVARAVGRLSYTRAQKANLMKEGRVLERCEFPVTSIPAIPYRLLETIADELVSSKHRRKRELVTDPSSGSALPSSTPKTSGGS